MNAQCTMAPASVLQSSIQSSSPLLPITKDEINALHNEFRKCGKNAREWLRQCQMMLPRIRDEEVWRKKGYNSIYDYARILAGMSKNSVDDALWIMDKIANKPELQKIAREKGLSAVRPVVAIATEETSQFWAEKASDMSQNTLKTYVRNSRENSLLDSRVNPSQRIASQDADISSTRRPAGEVQTASVYMKLEVEVIEKLKQIKGDRDWNELMRDLLEGKVREKLLVGGDDGRRDRNDGSTGKSEEMFEPGNAASHCETQEKPAPINTGHGSRRRLARRDKGRSNHHVIQQTSGLCAYPGCTKPYEILHHTKRFALDKTHDPDTIKPLCKAHERLAHKGLIENEETMPVNWALLTEPDMRNPKYAIDKKVDEYYAPKLE